MATPHEANLQRLGRLVTQRRVELGWHKRDAALKADLTNTTYMRVENGLSVRDVTYAKLEKAFGWVAGACMAVVNGDALKAQLAGEVVRGVRIAPDATADEARGAVHNAVIATLPDTPAGKMAELSEAVLKELQRVGIVSPPDGDSSP